MPHISLNLPARKSSMALFATISSFPDAASFSNCESHSLRQIPQTTDENWQGHRT